MMFRSLTAIALVMLATAHTVRAQDEEARKHLLHELGGPFFVSREKVQEELKLSDDQKQKLLAKLSDDVRETKKVFEKLVDLKAGDRDQEMQAHRQKSGKKLEAYLKETLKADQLERFQQLKLNTTHRSTMLQPEIVKELEITDAATEAVHGRHFGDAKGD